MGKTTTHPKLIILAGILIIIAGGVFWFSFHTSTPTSMLKETADREPLGKLEQFVYTRTVNGDTRWELKAKEALYFQEENELQLVAVQGNVISEERKITLKGERGLYNLDSKKGSLTGNVVGRSSDGYTLYATELSFDASARTVSTNEAIMLESEGITLQGIGMDLDLVDQTFKLHEHVRADFWQRDSR